MTSPPGIYSQATTLEAEFVILRELEGEARRALWPYLSRLWGVWLAWLGTNPRRKTERKGLQFDGYVSAFADASGLKVSGLYNHLPAARFLYEAARWDIQDKYPVLVTISHTMDTEPAVTLGKALEAGHTPESLEGALQAAPDLSSGLEVIKARLSEGTRNSNGPRKDARESAHARLRDLAPDAPEGSRERDALIYGAFDALPEPTARAALHAAQTGDRALLDDLGVALTPGYVDFLKGYFPCFVTGDYPTPDSPNDGHHIRVGEVEARPGDDTPEVYVGVARRAHIPLPFAPDSGAAHSRAYIVGNDASRLAALNRWQACAVRAYAAFVRGNEWRVFAEQARKERLNT